MNRKIVIGAVAGVAAVGLAYGGTTYSAWSDFGSVTGNTAGASILKLNLDANSGSDLKFDHVKMAPGGIDTQRNVYIASNDAASAPDAKLYISLKNVVGVENGCDSNGEQQDDPACANPAASQGQFISDANVQWTSYTVNSPDECNQSYAPGGHAVTPMHGGSLATLAAQTATTPWELTGDMSSSGGAAVPVLHPGQGLCVSMTIGLAHAVNNASQGDSANFDLRFDLVQP